MAIEQELRTRLTEAIKAKDLRTANVIRMISTKVMERRTAAGFSGAVDDALYEEVISAYSKSLDKARKQYEAAGERGAASAADLAWEIDYLDQFLPQPLGEDEVRAAVAEAIRELGAADPKMAGRVVGAVMKKHKGRVDAALVKRIAEAALAGG